MAFAPLLRQVCQTKGYFQLITNGLQHVLPLAGLTTALALAPKRSVYAEEVVDPVKSIVSISGLWSCEQKAYTA